MSRDADRKYGERSRSAVRPGRLMLALAVLLFGCAGGIPSIPDGPDQILAKGDGYFAKEKYFQSQELYKAFLQRHPGDDRSDYAQFMLAESYYNDEDFALAAVEYRILVTNYGYSDYVDDGYYKEALSLYHQAPKPPLDQTKRYDALDKLQRFVQVFPQSPLVAEARDYTEKIKESLAEKELANALFYLKTKRNDSALIYLNKIINNYPNNEFWARAIYYKARVLLDRGQEDEAERLFSQVLAYPSDLDIKQEAQRALHQLSKD